MSEFGFRDLRNKVATILLMYQQFFISVDDCLGLHEIALVGRSEHLKEMAGNIET